MFPSIIPVKRHPKAQIKRDIRLSVITELVSSKKDLKVAANSDGSSIIFLIMLNKNSMKLTTSITVECPN